MDLDAEASERTQEIEERMTQAAIAEVWFMSAIWDRDYATARQELEAVIQETARADEKLSGWHKLWLGMCLECEKDYNPIYYKKDVEQGHDHLEWIRQNYQNCLCLGLVYVGSYGKREKAANPCDPILLV